MPFPTPPSLSPSPSSPSFPPHLLPAIVPTPSLQWFLCVSLHNNTTTEGRSSAFQRGREGEREGGRREGGREGGRQRNREDEMKDDPMPVATGRAPARGCGGHLTQEAAMHGLLVCGNKLSRSLPPTEHAQQVMSMGILWSMPHEPPGEGSYLLSLPPLSPCPTLLPPLVHMLLFRHMRIHCVLATGRPSPLPGPTTGRPSPLPGLSWPGQGLDHAAGEAAAGT